MLERRRGDRIKSWDEPVVLEEVFQVSGKMKMYGRATYHFNQLPILG